MFGYFIFFFFKQKTAYEMRISDWSSDVCSSDLVHHPAPSSCAASKRSREISSTNCFTSRIVNAFAPAGSHTAQGVSVRLTPSSGMSSTVGYSEMSVTVASKHRVPRNTPYTERKSVWLEKRDAVRCGLGGCRDIQKKK